MLRIQFKEEEYLSQMRVVIDTGSIYITVMLTLLRFPLEYSRFMGHLISLYPK